METQRSIPKPAPRTIYTIRAVNPDGAPMAPIDTDDLIEAERRVAALSTLGYTDFRIRIGRPRV